MKKIMFLVILVLALSLPVFAQEFPDVPTDHWAYNAVQTLVDAGIIQGYPDGTFGGKRALTRYEFAEALAKAIPVIAEQVSGGTKGEKGEKGEAGPAGPQGPAGPAGQGVSPEQLAALQRMANEFRDELAALGVDVDQLKRDVAALQERVTNIENEQKRVVLTGEVNFIGRGEVRNTAAQPFDRDNRALGVGPFDSNSNNPLNRTNFYTDYQFGIKGRVSDNVSVNGIIAAGNYLPEFAGVASDDFTLWNMYANAGVNLGPLGATDLVVGRFPFQLTPLTLKFVDPDSYTNIGKLDSGDYVLDGGSATFKIGKLGVTAFAAKAANEAELGDLITPDLMLTNNSEVVTPYQFTEGVEEVAQLAGARAVIGTPLNGNLGLTYYQTGQRTITGTAQIMGADLNASIGKIGIAGEYAKSDPNDTLENAVTGNGDTIGNDNTAWNAGLNFQVGNLGIGGGYTNVEANYFAPGYWSRAGEAVNLANVKGATANLNYAFSKRISLAGNAMFLQPDKDSANVVARSATTQSAGFVDLPSTIVDKITSWKAGLKYGLTSANSVDLGWEEVNWKPVSGSDTKERYISIGVGHTFNPNSSLKLLYQIVSYDQGGLSPYGDEADFRGGVASAQFQLKY